MKRAQITMESLLLYGAAILVVLLAIAALTYFGVFNLGSLLPQSCNLEDTSIFKCDEYRVSKAGPSVTIVLKNVASRPVEVAHADVMFTAPGYTTGCADAAAGTETITPGGTQPFVIDCASMSANQGDRIKGTIDLKSKFSDGTLTTPTQGTLTARVGP